MQVIKGCSNAWLFFGKLENVDPFLYIAWLSLPKKTTISSVHIIEVFAGCKSKA